MSNENETQNEAAKVTLELFPGGPRRRLKSCVEAWPDCVEGQYNPSCCRFPKSCSCDRYSADLIRDDQLEPVRQHAAASATALAEASATTDLPPAPQARRTALSDATRTAFLDSLAEPAIIAAGHTTLAGNRGAQIRAAVEAVYPAIRLQVAEEIAAKLDAIPAEVYPEDIFPPDGTSIDSQSARVMRFAYPAAANIAREIGAEA